MIPLDTALALKNAVDILKEIVDQATFEITQEGIVVQAVDSAHVGLLWLRLKSPNGCPQPKRIGVHLGMLQRALKCLDPNDPVTLEVSTDTLTLVGHGERRHGHFDLRLLTLEDDAFDIPLETSVEASVVELPSAEVARMVRDLASFGSDSVVLETTEEGLSFQVTADMGTVTTVLKARPSQGKPQKVTVSLKYLCSFTTKAAVNTSPTVRLEVEQGCPLVVCYGPDVRMYLAPKMDEDPTED